jgi:hypothetical protein
MSKKSLTYTLDHHLSLTDDHLNKKNTSCCETERITEKHSAQGITKKIEAMIPED